VSGLAAAEGDRQVIIGISLKLYLDVGATITWARAVSSIARAHPSITAGTTRMIVLPTLPAIPAAIHEFAETRIGIGAQDLFWRDTGPYTGAVSGADLRAIGCGYVEIGHAERRRVFGEGIEIARLKFGAALRNGLTPIVCVGESAPHEADAAAQDVLGALDDVVGGVAADSRWPELIVAYEPEWAIGGEDAAPAAHILTVVGALRARLESDPRFERTAVIYGGSAQAGTFAQLGDSVDGLFLGRFAHDPRTVKDILDEAEEFAPSSH